MLITLISSWPCLKIQDGIQVKSGFMLVNYTMATPSVWGKNKGCSFVYSKCLVRDTQVGFTSSSFMGGDFAREAGRALSGGFVSLIQFIYRMMLFIHLQIKLVFRNLIALRICGIQLISLMKRLIFVNQLQTDM